MARDESLLVDKAGGRRPEHSFSVVVGYETFAGRVCETEDGTVVTPGTLTSRLDQASVERIVFGSPSRVMDVGVRTRFFTGALSRMPGGPLHSPGCMTAAGTHSGGLRWR